MFFQRNKTEKNHPLKVPELWKGEKIPIAFLPFLCNLLKMVKILQ
jgi:hypothetical protein